MEDNDKGSRILRKILIALITSKGFVASGIMLLVGIFLVGSSLGSFILHHNYIETEATIVDSKYDKETKEYYPVYEYEYNGKTVRVESHYGDDKIEIGKIDIIKYDPDNYEIFDVGSNELDVTFLIMGGILIAISAMFIYGIVKALIS